LAQNQVTLIRKNALPLTIEAEQYCCKIVGDALIICASIPLGWKLDFYNGPDCRGSQISWGNRNFVNLFRRFRGDISAKLTKFSEESLY
jgi:hypothetical protein